MTDTRQSQAARLDSWKAIASYLGRDERTVRRWEKELQLPVRRVAITRGHSVFAYVSEIEQWLKGHPLREAGAAPDNVPTLVEQSSPAPAVGRVSARAAQWRSALLATAGVGAALLIVVWRASVVGRGEGPSRVQVTSAAVVATDATGAELWRYGFPPDEHVDVEPAIVRENGDTYVLVGARHRLTDGVNLNGGLLWFDSGGQLRHTASLDDHVQFGAGDYAAPWPLIHAQLDTAGNSGRIAVTAHHAIWWPGILTLFDAHLRRQASFVNAGWIEDVGWVSANRIAISGFSNAHDGGVVALIDPDAPDGQSPEPAGSAYHCTSCGAGAPVRYIVLPRSELNRVSGSGFNRARLYVADHRIQVRTDEVVEGNAYVADALYEFSPSLDLLSASYSDRYWDMHRALEEQGKITHSRAACPYGSGPAEMMVWDPSTGWRKITIRH